MVSSEVVDYINCYAKIARVYTEKYRTVQRARKG